MTISGKTIAIIAISVFVGVVAAYLFITSMRPHTLLNPSPEQIQAQKELPKKAARTPRGADNY